MPSCATLAYTLHAPFNTKSRLSVADLVDHVVTVKICVSSLGQLPVLVLLAALKAASRAVCHRVRVGPDGRADGNAFGASCR